MIEFFIKICDCFPKLSFFRFIKYMCINYRELVMYGICGLGSSGVTVTFYMSLSLIFGAKYYQIWNIIAWIASVTFAYITNRKFVFLSRKNGKTDIAKETASFFTCRFLSLLFEMGAMQWTVSILGYNDKLMKICVGITAGILNYGCSKLLVFRKEKNNTTDNF